MTWTVDAALTHSTPAEGTGYLGIGLAISGDGLVMAASRYGFNPSSGAGGVFIFDRVGSAWVQRGSVLLPSDAAGSFRFGSGLALNEDGSILAVGSEGRAYDYYSYGSVYIYDWSGSAWVKRSVVNAGDHAETDKFGASVALNAAGTMLVVGAYLWEGANSNQGGAYIYDWSGTDWVQRGSVITAASPASSANFGYAVALNPAGTILAVGEPYRTGTLSSQGAVHVFDWSGSAWTPRSIFYDPSAAASDRFGRAVALAGTGNYLLVGAPERNSAATDAGIAYLFEWVTGAWTLLQTFTAADAGSGDLFGLGVALSSDVVTAVISSVTWDGTYSDQGAIYTYTNDSPPDIDPPPEEEEPASISSPHVYHLSAYISGTEDGLEDFAFSISSFALTKRDAETSYYAVTAPFTGDLIDALVARPNGLIHILRDSAAWEYFNIALPIRYDIGPRNSSINISGTRQETNLEPVTHAIEPNMATSEAINSSGLLTLGMVPGYLDPMPGDAVRWDGTDYTLTLIKWQAGSDGMTLAYNCAPV